MFKFLFGLWDKTNRNTDMQILWPICKEHAASLDHAKAAFFMHVSNDPCWYEHYSESDLIAFVDNLQ